METLRIGPAPLHPGAEQFMVPMRDGTRLATDVYLPPAPGRHPVVVSRMPYDKASAWMAVDRIAPRYLERGYVFVAQDVRGKFRSEGETMPFVHEVEDTYDTLDWVVGQPWSDGAVAMTGDSYHGYTQWAGVAGGHPALRAVAPRVTGTGISDMLLAGRVSCLYQAAYFAHMWVDRDVHYYETDWSVRPLREVFEPAFSAIGARSAAVDAMLAGWPPVNPFASRHPFTARPVPVLHRVGWFDNLIDLSMRDHSAQLAVPAWRDLAYLDADACDHHTYHLAQAPVAPADDHALDTALLDRILPRYLGRTLDFFDVFVRGLRPVTSLSRATWFQGHDGERTAGEWPPRDAVELLLHPSGNALATTPETGARVVRWTHDPADPVPSIVKDPWVFLHEYPDESPLHDRPDVVVFTGEPAGRPLDLTGPVNALVAVETDASSMHLFVKLHDVAPDGSAHMISRGQALITGPAGVQVDLGHTGYRLRSGHRLRLVLSCSDYPLFAPHPGTAEDPWSATATRPSVQTLRPAATFLSLTVTR
jgi:uncharacterized protein